MRMGRRLYRFLLATFAAALTLSCAKEEPVFEGFYLDASMPSGETKTTLGNKSGDVYPVLWSEGDVISVNGVASDPLTAAQAGSSVARFHFPVPVPPPYNVAYGDGVPAVQAYNDGNIRSGYAPMAAQSDVNSFVMKHLAAILRIPLTGNVSVAGISARSLDGTPLSMTGNSVQLTLPEGGVSISGGKTFFLVLAEASLAKGLCLDVYTTTGERMNLTSFVGKKLTAGSIYEFPATVFEANAESVVPISGFEELRTFAASSDNNSHARLVADIEVPAGFDGFVLPDGFQADIDGGGYTVSGLRKAFVHVLDGCLRNINFEGNITVSSSADIAGVASDYWVGMVANKLFTGALVENCTVNGSITYNQWGKSLAVGGVAGYASRGTVRGCVNKAAITAVGDGSNAVHAGGIVGQTYASGEVVSIAHCRNQGTVLARGGLKSLNLGGIVGNMGTVHTSTLLGDVNIGNVTVDGSASLNGIVNLGGIAGNSLNALKDCVNRGVLSQGASSAQAQNVGGIAGNVVADSVQGCVNAGSIVMDGASATGDVSCGGILGYVAGDTSVNSIAVDGCTFEGAISISMASHGTVHANAITGLYSIGTHSQTSCVNRGTISQR